MTAAATHSIKLKNIIVIFAEEKICTPRRELAPPIEEDEEQDSESQRGAPLRQIENNISALLRGDIIVARVGNKGMKVFIHFLFMNINSSEQIQQQRYQDVH